MANTDIYRQNNVVNIAFAGSTTSQLAIPVGTPVTYKFVGNNFRIVVFDDEYEVPFSTLNVEGSHPATIADAYTALTTVFSP